MALKVLALDLERTLISDAMNREPRPGLFAFLQWCMENFERVALFTSVSRPTVESVLAELWQSHQIPTAFLDRWEYIIWQGKYKDLPFVPGATLEEVILVEVILVDDDLGWAASGQEEQALAIAEYDPYLVHGDDTELERIRQVLQERVGGREWDTSTNTRPFRAASFCLLLLFLFSIVLPVSAAEVVLKRSKAGYYSAEARLPDAKGTPFAALAQRTCVQWAKQDMANFVKVTEEILRDVKGARGRCSYETTGKITYRSPRLLSVLLDNYEYAGGAHPSHAYKTFTFGMVDGKPKQMKLADFFRSASDYKQQVSDAVINKLMLDENAIWVLNGEMKKLNAAQLERFVVEPDGLRFLINEYEAGPYAVGRFEIKLTMQELGTDFKRALILGRTAPMRSKK